jgi:hypothetical protein
VATLAVQPASIVAVPETPSAYANAAVFAQPHWLVIARGFDTERWFNDGQAIGTGGVVNPQPTSLPAGHYYYRFASGSSPRAAQAGGGWWIDYENLMAIRRFAQANGYRVRDAARLMLALPYAWTRVDRMVRALLLRPLRAWSGAGKPAQSPEGGADRGTRWIPTQHIKVRQLYVPGLALPAEDGRPLHEAVFGQPVQIGPID